jgi:hypothetical protein
LKHLAKPFRKCFFRIANNLAAKNIPDRVHVHGSFLITEVLFQLGEILKPQAQSNFFWNVP